MNYPRNYPWWFCSSLMCWLLNIISKAAAINSVHMSQPTYILSSRFMLPSCRKQNQSWTSCSTYCSRFSNFPHLRILHRSSFAPWCKFVSTKKTNKTFATINYVKTMLIVGRIAINAGSRNFHFLLAFPFISNLPLLDMATSAASRFKQSIILLRLSVINSLLNWMSSSNCNDEEIFIV